jgi:hypothetical protein
VLVVLVRVHEVFTSPHNRRAPAISQCKLRRLLYKTRAEGGKMWSAEQEYEPPQSKIYVFLPYCDFFIEPPPRPIPSGRWYSGAAEIFPLIA